jgi:hypothetical protein
MCKVGVAWEVPVGAGLCTLLACWWAVRGACDLPCGQSTHAVAPFVVVTYVPPPQLSLPPLVPAALICTPAPVVVAPAVAVMSPPAQWGSDGTALHVVQPPALAMIADTIFIFSAVGEGEGAGEGGEGEGAGEGAGEGGSNSSGNPPPLLPPPLPPPPPPSPAPSNLLSAASSSASTTFSSRPVKAFIIFIGLPCTLGWYSWISSSTVNWPVVQHESTGRGKTNRAVGDQITSIRPTPPPPPLSPPPLSLSPSLPLSLSFSPSPPPSLSHTTLQGIRHARTRGAACAICLVPNRTRRAIGSRWLLLAVLARRTGCRHAACAGGGGYLAPGAAGTRGCTACATGGGGRMREIE